MYLKWDEQTITDFSAENIDTMYNRGFVFTRPNEGRMEQTRSARVDLSKFELSSENRRILRKTEGLMLNVHTLPYSQYNWEIGKLAKDFYTTKFGDGTFSANKAKELLASGRRDFNRLFAYSLNEEVLGYCISVETPDMLHYSYPFYDLETAPKDMGLGMMTRAIVWAKENGKKYIYLGSAQRESDTYKFQFSGIEVFEQTRWTHRLDGSN
jgi:arginyl-tRNA--protein-N-Asp/Glu arginylyltransferase